LDGLLAPLRVTGAQRRREDLLEQRGLAVGGGAEHAQVAATDAEAGQLERVAHDLALGVVVPDLTLPLLALDHPELLELAHERLLGARLLEHVVQRVDGAGALHGHRGTAKRARIRRTPTRSGVRLCASRRELLPDYTQRQELVSLEAKDRAQPGD